MELTITRLGRKGDGIAEGPDGTVFAPFTLPGEMVSGEVATGRMESAKITRPSDHRVAAPCGHFKRCGGCALQHAADPFLAAWKREQVIAALGAQRIETEVAETVTSPRRSRRRATFSARRTKKGATVGFHARRAGEIVAIGDCPLIAPALMAAIPATEALARAGGSRKGELKCAVTVTDSGLDVSVTGGKALEEGAEGAARRMDLAAIAGAHDLARLTWGDEPIALNRPPALRFGAAVIHPPPGAFLQATAEGEAALVRLVKEGVGEAARIADLFAGCGTFALPLSERAEVLAVEGDAALTGALDAGWRGSTGLKRLSAETRDLFRRPLLPAELNAFEAVVFDPPRAGAERQAIEIARSDVPRVVGVSCHPATFARDAAILIEGGYDLLRVTPVDQFRWSGHVELVGVFRR